MGTNVSLNLEGIPLLYQEEINFACGRNNGTVCDIMKNDVES